MSTQVKFLTLWLRSWDRDYSIEKNHKVQFSTNQMPNDEIKKKSILQKNKN
jgi:hypothetical protein